jgi:hypothetical protein
MKIEQAVYKLLPSEIQATFTKVAGTDGDSAEYDNGEESAGGLKTALQKEKEEKAAIKAKLDAADAAKAREIEDARKKAVEEAREKGDFKAVEDDYKRRIKELEDGQKKAAKEAEDRTKADAINKAADEVAKMFTAPKAMTPFVKSRLSVDLVDGAAIVRVLDKDGKASGLSLEDLRKEYLTDPDLKASITASKGTGGGSGVPPVSGGAGTAVDEKFDAANAAPKDMVARLEAKGLVSEDGDDD